MSYRVTDKNVKHYLVGEGGEEAKSEVICRKKESNDCISFFFVCKVSASLNIDLGV